MDADDAPLPRRRSGSAVGRLLLAHAVIAVALVATAFTHALSLDATIGRDELYRLRSAFGWTMAGAFLPLTVAAVATWLLELFRPGRAWVAPVVGMCVSITLCVAMLPFIHPESVIGR